MKKISLILTLIFCLTLVTYSQTTEAESAKELEKVERQIRETEKTKEAAELKREKLLVQYTPEYWEVKETHIDIKFANEKLVKLNKRKKELEKVVKVKALPNDQTELLKIIVRQNQRIIELLEAQNNDSMKDAADKDAIYPSVPSKLMKGEILLADKKTTITLNDYIDKVIVLSFVEPWAKPAMMTAKFLDEYRSKNLDKNLQIFAISTTTDEGKEAFFADKTFFQNYVKTLKLKIDTGWAREKFAKEFMQISQSDKVVPLSFVIKDGKIRSIFIGNSPKVKKQLADELDNLLNVKEGSDRADK